MNRILNFIFEQISPDYKVTWLSRQFSRFEKKRRKSKNEIHRRCLEKDSLFFDVKGAGDIAISESCFHCCGGVVGFAFSVEWGQYGFVGGVIGRDEAKRMAEFILQKCSETTETMEESRIRINSEFEKYLDSI